jgi:osmotically-inducible protein OsmY
MMATSVLSSELQELVQNELLWDPEVTSSSIGVTSKDGVVTLSGFVPSYAERMAAERAALRVYGTRGVANDLTVKLAGDRIDPDIAKDAVDALKFNLSVPKTVKVAVRDAHVTLEGTCEWWFQRNAAENAVRHLAGVKGVNNFITIKPRVSPEMVKAKIEAALRRSAELDAKDVNVVAVGGKVTLSGHVRSYAERLEAERAAWAAPGVTTVENDIFITP